MGGGFYHSLFTGQELLEKGSAREAREHFEDALALQPDHPEALAGLALAAFKQNDFEPASEAYSRLIQITPEQATLYVNLGIVNLKLGQLDEAEVNFEKALELGGDSPKVQNYLGLIYSKRGEYARALDAFRQSGSHRMAKQMDELLEKARNAGGAVVSESEKDVEILVNAEVDAVQATHHSAPAGGGNGAASLPPVPAESLLSASMPPPAPTPVETVAEPAPAEISPETSVPPDPDAERRRSIMKMGQRAAGISSAAPAAESFSLTQLKTDAPRLRMPATSPEPFTIVGGVGGGGVLRARLDAKICAKIHGAALVRGDLTVSEPLHKKFKGRKTNVLFGETSRPIHRLEGTGEIVWNSGRDVFHRLTLEGDKIFLNERVLFAFTAALGWENGRITMGDLEGVHLVNFTGRGDIILRIEGPMTVVELSGDQPLKVRADRLLGWRGRIAPRMEVAGEGSIFPADTPVLHMQGEGNLFLGAA